MGCTHSGNSSSGLPMRVHMEGVAEGLVFWPSLVTSWMER
ncbi:hypothetical protein 2209_scaffold1451_00002 [Bacteriophage sp.]|nr:hypothetical protein 2209_scaffold1451_00002 [Bacteriophage sp.]